MIEHKDCKRSMKVGIVTMHRVPNYGSILQTYALQKSILNFGLDCEVIDYIYPNDYHKKNKPKSGSASMLQVIEKSMNKIITRQKKRELAFSEFISEYVTLSEEQFPTIESLRQSPLNYDVYVSGSDQVWNTEYLDEDTTFLFGLAPEAAKRISYAASFGGSSFDQRYAPLYREYLLKFAHISVREDPGIQVVADLTGQRSQSVLDPGLLLSFDDWKPLAIAPKLKKKYILCYFLGYKFNPQPYADDLAKQVRQATGYELVFISPHPFKDKILDTSVHTVFDAGPREFLGWFANAEVVLTTSYHGTALAINFNKRFFSIVNDAPTLDCRQKSLLDQFNLQDQILPVNTPLPDLSRLQPDSGKVNVLLSIARQKSLDYLSDSLNN